MGIQSVQNVEKVQPQVLQQHLAHQSLSGSGNCKTQASSQGEAAATTHRIQKNNASTLTLNLNQITPVIGPLNGQNALVKNRNHNATVNLAGVHGLINANYTGSVASMVKATESKGSFQTISYQSVKKVDGRSPDGKPMRKSMMHVPSGSSAYMT